MGEWWQRVQLRWYSERMLDKNACLLCAGQRPPERSTEWCCSDECDAELSRREESPF